MEENVEKLSFIFDERELKIFQRPYREGGKNNTFQLKNWRFCHKLYFYHSAIT